MIEVENTDVNIVRNLIPMRNHMPASAYGLKAISDWFSFDSVRRFGSAPDNPQERSVDLQGVKV